jgi:hypothetical protein
MRAAALGKDRSLDSLETAVGFRGASSWGALCFRVRPTGLAVGRATGLAPGLPTDFAAAFTTGFTAGLAADFDFVPAGVAARRGRELLRRRLPEVADRLGDLAALLMAFRLNPGLRFIPSLSPDGPAGPVSGQV